VTPSNKVVIFGGKRTPTECIKDIQILTFNQNDSSGHWEAGPEFPDTCRWGHASAIMVDPKTGEEVLIVSGGRRSDYDYYGDIWFYYINSKKWKHIFDPEKTTLKSYPVARDHHVIEYIPEDHAIYLFVGRKIHESSPPLNDAWKFSFIDYTWTELKPLPTVGRFLPGVSLYYRNHDVSHPAIDLIGGCEITSSGKIIDLNDVWEYYPTKNEWKQLTKTGCHTGDVFLFTDYLVRPNVLITLTGIILTSGAILICYTTYKNHNPQNKNKDIVF